MQIEGKKLQNELGGMEQLLAEVVDDDDDDEKDDGDNEDVADDDDDGDDDDEDDDDHDVSDVEAYIGTEVESDVTETDEDEVPG